jgi:Ca2+/Na+ antiporter
MNSSGLDIFTHVRVLVGIVLGLGVTRMLAGLAKFVQHPGRKPLYATHLLWIAVLLLSIIHFWWFELGLARVHPWPFELFVFVLFYAFLLYLMTTMLMPDEIDEYESYEDYFISRRAWFFGLLAATVPVDLIDTLVKGPAYFHSLGPEYPIRLGAVLVLCAIAAWTRNRRFHLAFAALYFLYLLAWIGRLYRVLD